MDEVRGQRWLAIGGLVFAALVITVGVLTPSGLSSHASAANAVTYIHDHRGAMMASSFVIGAAVFEGLFFFWYLRGFLARPSTRHVGTVGYAGIVLFAASGGVDAGLRFAVAESVTHVDPTVTQALNVLYKDVPPFLGGVGIAVFLVAAGLAILWGMALPKWLGWVAIVLGVIALLVGPPAIALWLIIASIVILARAGRVVAAAA